MPLGFAKSTVWFEFLRQKYYFTDPSRFRYVLYQKISKCQKRRKNSRNFVYILSMKYETPFNLTIFFENSNIDFGGKVSNSFEK